MKKRIILLVVFTLSLSLMAEEADQSKASSPADAQPAAQESRESTPDQKDEFRSRQVKLMKKALKEIGVTEEQKARIFELQDEHMVKMKANWQRLNAARKDLSRLQNESAPMEEIDAAIQTVADAQAEQLRLIARNRREMETILGKEKSDRFMQNARKQFRRHGRRPGPDMPPHPGRDEAPGPPLPSERAGNNGEPPVPQKD